MLLGSLSPSSVYLWVALAMLLCIALLAPWIYQVTTQIPIPISVNYHLTRRCNKECGFCFHTAKSSHVASLEEAKRALTLLKHAGMKKINFAGGEPFLNPKFLGMQVDDNYMATIITWLKEC